MKTEEKKMLEFRYDTQLLIEGEDLDEDEISDYFTEHFKGVACHAVGQQEDCVVGGGVAVHGDSCDRFAGVLWIDCG